MNYRDNQYDRTQAYQIDGELLNRITAELNAAQSIISTGYTTIRGPQSVQMPQPTPHIALIEALAGDPPNNGCFQDQRDPTQHRAGQYDGKIYSCDIGSQYAGRVYTYSDKNATYVPTNDIVPIDASVWADLHGGNAVLGEGTLLVCWFHERRGRWLPITIAPMKPLITFQSLDRFSNTTRQFRGRILAQHGAGVRNPRDRVRILNPFAQEGGGVFMFRGRAGECGLAHFSESPNAYVILQFVCPF